MPSVQSVLHNRPSPAVVCRLQACLDGPPHPAHPYACFQRHVNGSIARKPSGAPLLAAGNGALWAGGSIPRRTQVERGTMMAWFSDALPMLSTIRYTTWSGPQVPSRCAAKRDPTAGGGTLRRFAEQYDITLKSWMSPDHANIFVLSFPPRDSIAQVVTRVRVLSAPHLSRVPTDQRRRGWELWEMAILLVRWGTRSPRK